MDFMTILKSGNNQSGFLNGVKNSLGNFSNWLFKGVDANKLTNLDRLGNILGGGAALYGAYNQQKMAKKNFDLQQDAYDFNKFLANEELKRRKNMENKLQNVWSD